MEDVEYYEYTVPSDDTVVLDTPDSSPIDHHCGDTCLDDHVLKGEVVLDSDDELSEQNEAGNFVIGECFNRSLSGRHHETGLLKTQRIRAGRFRRLDNKVSAQRFARLDSDKTARWVEEGNGGRNSFNNDSRDQDYRVDLDYPVSGSADQEYIATTAEKINGETEKLNILGESLTDELLDERKFSSHKSKAMDVEKDANYDFVHAKLNYFESPEHFSESQSKALDFVDHYLSVSDLGSYKDVETRKSERIMSPPPLRSKGSHSLARRINFGSPATVFDFAEKQVHKGECTSLRKTNDTIFGYRGEEPGYLCLDREPGDVNLQKEKIPSLHSKEKMSGNISSPKKLDTSSMDENDIDKIGSNSEVCIAHDSMDLEEQFDAGLSWPNVENDEELKVTLDALGIGLDTQIAVEAMEALVHADPPMFDACFSHQSPDNTFVDSFTCVNRKSKSEKFAKPKEAFVGWRKKEKRSKCVKNSTFPDKNIFCSVEKRSKKQRTATQSAVSENMMTEKVLTGKDLNCRKTVNRENRKSGVSTRITVLQEKHREQDSLIEFQKENCFPESYGCNNQDARRLKETFHAIKSDSPQKQRKMNSFHEDVHKIGVREKSLNVNSDSSFQVTVDGDKSLPKLSPWIYPKGKRARRHVPDHSVRSSYQCSLGIVIENNAEKCPKQNEEANKRVSGLLVYTRKRQFVPQHSVRTSNQCSPFVEIDNNAEKCPVLNEEANKKVSGLLVYTRRRQFVPRHSVRTSNQCSPCVGIENNAEKVHVLNEEANKRVSGLLVYTRRRRRSSKSKPLEKFLEQDGGLTSPPVNHHPFSIGCHESDERNFSPAINTAVNIKSDVLSNGICNIVQVSEGSDRINFKQPSRSPLMKELTRLGYTESLPNFLSKDLRRRRAIGKCCILFSQNLDTSMLKQQKKIVARLGFSIASCCSDATHFVTDKFVRTRNMLEAIALCKPVVTHLWLESCEQAGYVIDEKNYILRDEKKEKEIGFSMPASLTRASQHPLLKGRRVFITPNVKPSMDAIHCLIKAVHGEIVENILSGNTMNKAIPDDLLIVSCEEDYRICVPFLEKGASIYNSELLLNGIVTQRLECDRHQLFVEISNNSSL